jgi:hypothetical protein
MRSDFAAKEAVFIPLTIQVEKWIFLLSLALPD